MVYILSYFRPLKLDSCTLSIDNIVIDYYLAGGHPWTDSEGETHYPIREIFLHLLQRVTSEYLCELTHWDSSKMGSFKMQFTITFHDGESFWIGMGLNTTKTHYGRVRLDFNPNKVANHDCFRKILAFLNTFSRPMHTNIRRYDLAMDYPVLRENVFLVKDNRQYSEFSNSLANRTQYLGPGQNPGRVKLYNKQLESKLNYPLTRLELTLDPEQKFEDIRFPQVYYIKDLQLTFDDLKLSSTDRFILNALLHGCGSLSMLDYYLRKKYEKLLDHYVEYFRLERNEYNAILNQLRDFLHYPRIPLDSRNLDLDYLKPYEEALIPDAVSA